MSPDPPVPASPPPLAYAVPAATDEEASRRSARRLIGAGVVAWAAWYAMRMVLEELQWPFWNALRADGMLDYATRGMAAITYLAAIAGGVLIIRGRRIGARLAMAAATLVLAASMAMWIQRYSDFPQMFDPYTRNGPIGEALQAMSSLGYLLTPLLVALMTAPPVARVLRLR